VGKNGGFLCPCSLCVRARETKPTLRSRETPRLVAKTLSVRRVPRVLNGAAQ